MKLNLTIIILSLCVINLTAQVKIHHHITTEDGLVSNQVVKIFQDTNGFMWFGTFGGVSKWDGKDFINYTTADGLASVPVVNIVEGTDGSMYFSTYGKGITVFNPDGSIDTLTKVNGLQQNFIMGMARLSNGTLAFGNGSTITIWDKLNFVEDLAQKFKFRDLNIGSVSSIKELITGEVYVSSSTIGLLKLSKKTYTNYSMNDGLNSNWILDIDSLNDSTIILSGTKGINYLDNNEISSLDFDEVVYQTIVSENNTTYSASNAGLLIVDKIKSKLLKKENGLIHNHLSDIYEAKDGSIFIGYKGDGVSFFKPNKIESYNSESDLYNSNITTIFQSNDNEILLGTEHGMFSLSTKNSKSSLQNYYITSVVELESNKYLLGTRYNGVIIYNEGIQRIIDQADGLLSNKINILYKGFDNNIYIGTERGISVIKNNKIVDNIKRELPNIKSGLQNKFQLVQSIIQLEDSSLVIGYHGSGISFYKNTFLKQLTSEDGLSNEVINSLYRDKTGNILIGTDQGGLNIFDGTNIRIINTDSGLTSNTVKAITEDDYGNIYVSTNKGVNIITFYAGEPFIRTMNKEDGLASNDCNHGSILKDFSGNIWIGTKYGITKYNPSADKPNTTPPKIHFTNLQIFNDDYSIKDFLNDPTLNYNQNYIKLEYIGINLSAPNKTLYKYKLSGIDKDWVISKNTFVQYTNLDNDDYTFELKARNEWGYWSKAEIINFSVLPAWWETWWFYTLAIISIAALIAFIASYKYRNLLAVERVRTKISEDLHDNIGSGLTEITFLSEMVKSQTKNNNNAYRGLNNITDISKNLINDMKDIVWLVNPSTDTLKDLFNRLQDSYQEVLKFSDIALRFAGIEKLSKIRLPISYRQNIFLLFKEAINNSIKYSECSNIHIEVNIEGNLLSVVLIDDGKGFEQEDTKMGNGIKNMQKRASLVKGDINIQSKIGSGTIIKFKSKFSKLGITSV